MKFLEAAIFAALLAASVEPVSAQQPTFWPPMLSVPTYLPFDSSANLIHNSQSLSQDKYRTTDSLILSGLSEKNWIRQSAYYQFVDAYDLHSKTHSANLQGEYLRRRFPFYFSSVGLEWFPQFTYSRDVSGAGNNSSQLYSDILGSLRLGPVVALQYQNLPISLGGGPAINIWQNRMSADRSKDKLDSTKNEQGFYVHLDAGNIAVPLLPGLPFYAGGNILGLYLDSTKITMGNIRGIFAVAPKFADSLCASATDSLSIGRYASLSNYSYSSVPDKTNNAFYADAGFRDIGKLWLKPSIVWELLTRRSAYMAGTDHIGDERFTSNRFTAAVNDNDQLPIKCTAWFALKFDNNNDLPGTDFGSFPIAAASLSDTIKTHHNADSLAEKAKSYNGLETTLHLDASVNFLTHFYLAYHMNFVRDRQIYTNPYITTLHDTCILENSDRVSKQNIFEGRIMFNSALSTGVIGQYNQTATMYLKSRLSAGSNTEKLVKIEPYFKDSTDRILASLNVGASATRSSWYFPSSHLDDYPPWSRKFYGRISANFSGASGIFTLSLQSGLIYQDDGQYRSPRFSTTDKSGPDYYGITDHSLETNASLSGTFALPVGLFIKIGNDFRLIHYEEFNGLVFAKSASVPSTPTNIPYISLNAVNLFGSDACLTAGVKRHFGTGWVNYWEGACSIDLPI